MTDFLDLIKLLPSGAATVAVIAVVILFLKQQEKMNDVLKQITDKFNEQTTLSQRHFQEQINTLSNQQFTNQKSFQDQIQSLIDAHLKVSRETIAALKSLEATVSVIKDKVFYLPDQREKHG